MNAHENYQIWDVFSQSSHMVTGALSYISLETLAEQNSTLLKVTAFCLQTTLLKICLWVWSQFLQKGTPHT